MAKKIRAIMIVEVAGRPAQHVKDSIKAHVGQLRLKKEICVINESISNPRKVEGAEEMYTCFAEVEIEVENFARLTEIVFDYMPSSIEILNPDKVEMSLPEATTYLNTLAGRLHRYDEVAKIAQFQVQELAQRFQNMQQQRIPKILPVVEENKVEKKTNKKKSAKIKKSKKK
jgi:hypothetical protein